MQLQIPFRHYDHDVFPYISTVFDVFTCRYMVYCGEIFVIMLTNIRSGFWNNALFHWKIKRFGEIYQFIFGVVQKIIFIFEVFLSILSFYIYFQPKNKVCKKKKAVTIWISQQLFVVIIDF